MGKHVDKSSVMEIDFVNSTKDVFVEEQVVPRLDAGEKCFIVTANPEIVMEAVENPAYKQVVQGADFVVPDGIGVLVAAKLYGRPLRERIAGVELMEDLLAYANEGGLRCYFLGGKQESNDLAVENIQARFPNLIVAGAHHGYFDLDDEAVVDEVVAADADLVFAALGFPKQEFWIGRHLERFSKGVFVGVGGSIDIYAGTVDRAPDFWIKLNLEWFYRLVKQPFRWKRILKVFHFLWLALWRK